MRIDTTVLLAIAVLSCTAPAPWAAEQLYFPSSDADWATVAPESLGWDVAALQDVFTFVEETHGKSFLILKDGKIVAERYWTPAGAAHAQYVMSCGKSITAFLVGIAQEQGKLKIEQPASDFLGEGWTESSRAQERSITIKHMLKMTSGLTPGKAFQSPPDTKWFYNTTVYQDLHPLLEKAVGKTMQEFSDQVLFRPTGMSHSQFRVHSFRMTARDMGRFGLLILADGNWNGQQIMKHQKYFEAMLNTSQDLNLSYGYLWWLNGKDSRMTVGRRGSVLAGPIVPAAPRDMVCANGKGGQHIYIVPSQNLVVVRLGDSPVGAAPDTRVGATGGAPTDFNNQAWTKLMAAMHPRRDADEKGESNRVTTAP